MKTLLDWTGSRLQKIEALAATLPAAPSADPSLDGLCRYIRDAEERWNARSQTRRNAN